MTVAVSPADRRAILASPLRTFGIEVVDGASTAGAARQVGMERRSADELDRMWRPRKATRVLERRWRDGRLVMSVDHDPESGYRVYAPWNGRHLVAPDGGRIRSALPPSSPWRWQRLLFAQVLPLAATLQGLELLHASAVEWHGKTVAFVARAGTGKTSTAAHVVASGGTLLTDDVLALEIVDGAIVGHSGVPTLSIDRAELARMSADGRARVGAALGRADKLVLAVPVSPRARPLDGLYFLERPSAGELRVERRDPDPFLLLANSFNLYVRTPERIVNQLDVASRLAETVPLFTVRIPVGAAASDVARTVTEHAEGL
jgi:hypothetical protein